MPERLKMPDAAGGRGDRFLIRHAARAEINVYAVSRPDQLAQNLQLNRAHDLQFDAAGFRIPLNAQHRLLILQAAHDLQHPRFLNLARIPNARGQKRREHKAALLTARAQPVARRDPRQPRRRDQIARAGLAHLPELRTAVNAQLADLHAALRRVDFAARLKRARRQLQKHHAAALRVIAHLGRARLKRLAFMPLIVGRREQREHIQEILNPLAPKRRAGHQRERAALPHLPPERLEERVPIIAVRKIALEQRLIAAGHRFDRLAVQRAVRRKRISQIQHIAAQPLPDARDHRVRVCAGAINLVEEHTRRHLIALQQPPDRLRVALNALDGAHHHHGIVHHRQRALHLGGKVGVARRIHQIPCVAVIVEARLIGKYRNAALALDGMAVHERVLVIHAATGAQRVGMIEDLLGKRGFARIDVRQNPDGLFHRLFPLARHAAGRLFILRSAPPRPSQTVYTT